MEDHYILRKHGDWLERQASDFIEKYLPSYELNWSSYIGHQGNGKMAEMKENSEEEELRRMDFSQHHYTILESIFFMWLIVNELNQKKEVDSFDSYFNLNMRMMSYHAYFGRLRDNFERCFVIISGSDQAKTACVGLDKFWNHRNVVLHGKKLPLSISKELQLLMPNIQNNKVSRVGYGKNMDWQSVSKSEIDLVGKKFQESIDDIIPIVNSLLYKLFADIKKIIDLHRLALHRPGHYYDGHGYSGFSGASGSCDASGSYNDSITS